MPIRDAMTDDPVTRKVFGDAGIVARKIDDGSRPCKVDDFCFQFGMVKTGQRTVLERVFMQQEQGTVRAGASGALVVPDEKVPPKGIAAQVCPADSFQAKADCGLVHD